MLDIDGTLINREGNISAEDQAALRKAVNAGVRVSLSTGRAVQASLKIINQLSLDSYHIFFDGALVYNPGKVEEIYVTPISPELIRQMAEFARARDVNLDLYSVTRFFAEKESWVTDVRRRFFGLEPTLVDFAQVWPQEKIIKGTLVVRSAAEKNRAAIFRRHFENDLTFSLTKTPAYPDVDFINVIARGASKGKALKALVSFLGIPLSSVIAIGDGGNDASLLSEAGLAIAMGNATEELKDVADHITLDVDHHGVATAINKFLLSA